MSKPAVAFLRRYCALLDWISLEKPDAVVVWKAEEVGTWRTIQARWSASGAKLRFQFRVHNWVISAWVASMESNAGGATIRLHNRRKSVLDELRVFWEVANYSASSCLSLLETGQQWLRKELPGSVILLKSQRSDRTHTLSGGYLRVYARRGTSDYLLVACSAETAGPLASPLLTHGLQWLHYLRSKRLLRGIPTLYVLVPFGHGSALYHRARCLNPDRIRVEVWEYENVSQVEARPAPPPPPPQEDQDFRWPVLGPFRWSPQLERVLALAPDLMRRHPRFQDYDSLRILGLEFAQVLDVDRDRIRFGVGSQRCELTEANFEFLRLLIDEIVFFRRPDSPDPRHPYYRLQSERWLECLILEEAPRLFPELAPEAVYSQIPVYLGSDPGRIDILGVDREGTLVVIELKVSEDPDLPLQSLDYWGRVIQHNLRGDFERRGYFSVIGLNRRRPKIYLVSPVFSYHDSTERILAYMEADLEVWKISINEDWRSGVKVLARKRLRCGNLV